MRESTIFERQNLVSPEGEEATKAATGVWQINKGLLHHHHHHYHHHHHHHRHRRNHEDDHRHGFTQERAVGQLLVVKYCQAC